MSPEEQSRVLQGWLEQSPGTPPPSDLDAEVVQTVYALRPDLAPAPRVRIDEILDLVSSGPLAGAGARPVQVVDGGAEIVQFPGGRAGVQTVASEPAAAPSHGRWMRWVGGTGGIGLLLAAAATLVVIATPRDELPAAAPASEVAAAPARPAAQERAEPPTDVAEAPADLPPAPPAQGMGAGLPATLPAAPPKVLEMQGEATLRQDSVIPEVAEGMAAPLPPPPPPAETEVADQAVAAVPSARAGAAAPAASAPGGSTDLDQLRGKGSHNPGSGWRKGVDAAVLARLDLAITEAAGARAAGDLAGAAARLERELAPGTPGRAGQYLAWLAATDRLGAGDASEAARVARLGLGLSSSSSPERSALLVVLGDALRATGDVAGAESAYRQAR